EVPEEEDGGEDAADLHDEHHRVAHHLAGVELHERVAHRAPQDGGVEHRLLPGATALRAGAPGGRGRRSGGRLGRAGHGAPQKCPTRCSTTGPRARTGKKVRPTTMITTPSRRPVNSGVPVGNVPAEGGTGCLRASDPAMASTGTMRKKRPTSMARARVVLNQVVLPARPPNADRVLLAGAVWA